MNTSSKQTCFSLLWVINLGRQPRARADPLRVSICGLLRPSMYWDTRTSKRVNTNTHTTCRDYFQIQTSVKLVELGNNIQLTLHLWVSLARFGLVVLLTQGRQGRYYCNLQTKEDEDQWVISSWVNSFVLIKTNSSLDKYYINVCVCKFLPKICISLWMSNI